MMTNRNEYGTFEVARPSDDATGTLDTVVSAPAPSVCIQLVCFSMKGTAVTADLDLDEA